MTFDHSAPLDPRDVRQYVRVLSVARTVAGQVIAVVNAVGNEGRVLNVGRHGLPFVADRLAPSAVMAAPCLHYADDDALAEALLASVYHDAGDLALAPA